jgi:nicotinamide N-methyltransferase
MMMGDAEAIANEKSKNVTYHGVCLTVWSHADEERTHAIRRTLETAARNQSGVRSPKVSAASMASVPGNSGNGNGNSKSHKRGKSKGRKNSPWSGTEGEESESDAGVMSESDLEGPGGAGASTLFLPQNTVFWLPYALSECGSNPISLEEDG